MRIWNRLSILAFVFSSVHGLNALAVDPSKCVLAFLPKSVDQVTKQQMLQPEFQRLFIRYENTEITEPFYLRNLTASLIGEFIPWFHDASNAISYRQMLRNQHRVAGYGPEKKFRQGTFYNGEYHESIFTIRPGHLRSDLLMLPFTLGRLDLNFEDYIRDESERVTLTKERSIPIPGIAPPLWPKQEPDDDSGKITAKHTFPSFLSLRIYLNRLEILMSRIRKIPKEDQSEQFINLLGEYYFVAVHSHAFFRINNSLFMSQVNYILNYHGLRGMTHARMDIQALKSQDGLRSFLPIFRERARE